VLNTTYLAQRLYAQWSEYHIHALAHTALLSGNSMPPLTNVFSTHALAHTYTRVRAMIALSDVLGRCSVSRFGFFRFFYVFFLAFWAVAFVSRFGPLLGDSLCR
jgi:hypothetical protein